MLSNNQDLIWLALCENKPGACMRWGVFMAISTMMEYTYLIPNNLYKISSFCRLRKVRILPEYFAYIKKAVVFIMKIHFSKLKNCLKAIIGKP